MSNSCWSLCLSFAATSCGARTIVTEAEVNSTVDIQSSTSGFGNSPVVSKENCPVIDTSPYYPEPSSACSQASGNMNVEMRAERVWLENEQSPGYTGIITTPSAADINADGFPDLVFNTMKDHAYDEPGALVALSGADGSILWSKTTIGDYQPLATGSTGIADLDNDGSPEIITISTGGLLAVSSEGNFVWNTPLDFGMARQMPPAFGDMDNDGFPEIAVGSSVFDANGTLLWEGAGGKGGNDRVAVIMDLDGDNRQELIAGNTVYESDGSIRWETGEADNAGVGIAQLTGDLMPEVVFSNRSHLSAYSRNGKQIWRMYHQQDNAGPPVVSNFSGDNRAEIGVAACTSFTMYSSDGSELWSTPITDPNSCGVSASAFDFIGRGTPQVVVADATTLYVLSGENGQELGRWEPHSSDTKIEYPIILDIDLDGMAEIVIGSNRYKNENRTGLTVLGPHEQLWNRAGTIWNQHTYYRSNITADTQVPRNPTPPWQNHNSMRAAEVVEASYYDLDIGETIVQSSSCAQSQDGLQGRRVFVPIENRGSRTSPEALVSVTVRHPKTSEGSDRPRSDTFYVPQLPGSTVHWIGPMLIEDSATVLDIEVEHVQLGGTECDEQNNQRSIRLTNTLSD